MEIFFISALAILSAIWCFLHFFFPFVATPVLSGLHRLGRSRETLRALELRRNNILGNGHKMETLGAKNDFVVRNGVRSRPIEARRINDIFPGNLIHIVSKRYNAFSILTGNILVVGDS